MPELERREARRDGPDTERPGKPAAGRGAQLLPFPKLKRPRGRPRKDTPHAPAPEDFDVIAAAIRGLGASEVVWKRAAAEQRLAMQKLRLRPTTVAVADLVAEHLNREHGYDWHSSEDWAEALGCKTRSVKRAFEEGANAGFVKRRRCGDRWHTTLPKMVSLCMHVQRQLDADQGDQKTQSRGTGKSLKGDKKSGGRGTDNHLQGDRKIRRGTRNSAGGPENRGGLWTTSEQGDQKGISGGPNSPPAGPPPPSPPITPSTPTPSNPGNNQISALARADGFSKPDLASAAPRPEPRYDHALPLASRIHTWPFGPPAAEADLALYRRMRRLAKGWDCEVLKGQFVEWMTGRTAGRPAPNDALEAFLGWLASTAARRQPA